MRTEEETIESLKAWWKENGRAVIFGVVLGVGALIAIRYWYNYQATQQQSASILYDNLSTAFLAKNTEQAMGAAATLKAEYASSPYASLAGLQVAKQMVEQGNLEGASASLLWVKDNASDAIYAHIATLRLARVYMAQNKNESALDILNSMQAGGYSSQYDELKGDILLAEGKLVEASEKYRAALSQVKDNAARRQLLQMKLDDISGNK